MLNLNLESFMIELKDGSIANVGPTNKSASAKLFDVESAEAREFGDSQVKIVAGGRPTATRSRSRCPRRRPYRSPRTSRRYVRTVASSS